MKEDSVFLMCDCHSHALYVEKFEDEEEVCISLFELGYTGKTMTWTERLRWCYRIIIHGHPWTDSVILNKENQTQLKNFL